MFFFRFRTVQSLLVIRSTMLIYKLQEQNEHVYR